MDSVPASTTNVSSCAGWRWRRPTAPGSYRQTFARACSMPATSLSSVTWRAGSPSACGRVIHRCSPGVMTRWGMSGRSIAADAIEGPVRILALGGSLRQASFNRALLHEAAGLAPADIHLDLTVVDIVGALPLFDQDILDRGDPPSEAVRLKGALRAADGLVIATPEYNWSIP